MKTLIIAEAGVNHNGEFTLAKKLVERAAQAGADFVKFQTFTAENLASEAAPQAEYQAANLGKTQSQYEMLKQLELSHGQFRELARYAQQCGIQFLSTPFDLDSIAFLSGLDMPFWKIPSGEVTNYPYLVAIAKTGKDVVLSTGMCDLEEVGAAVRLLREHGSGGITLLHCNTEYPTPYEDVNLAAMDTLRDAFHLPVGYSDHTLGIAVPVAAVARGAVVIEKHFTLDNTLPGPDHKASLEPDGLAAMVQAIRQIEQAIGDGRKAPSASETKNIAIARKSIVARTAIRAGEVFTEDNLTTKRPGGGLSPMEWPHVLGRQASKDFAKDAMISL